MFKKLFNSSERITYGRLRKVCARHGAEVHAKVRIADVLPIERSGLPAPFFEFALQAHYDFVVMGPDHAPLLRWSSTDHSMMSSTPKEPFFGCSEFPRCRHTREIEYPR